MGNREQRGAQRQTQEYARLALAAGAFALCACEAIVGGDFDKAVLRPDPANTGVSNGGSGKCTQGEEQPCYDGPQATSGIGLCAAGVRTCGSDGAWGPCQGEITPRAEDASRRGDENCDGMSGECQWQARFGDSDSQRVHQLAVSVTGELFVSGTSDGTLDFGDGERTGSLYLAKFRSSGDIAWSKSFGAASIDSGVWVTGYADGGAVVGGHLVDGAADFGGGKLDAGPGSRAFVARFDQEGAHVWSRLFGGNSMSAHITLTVAAGPSGQIALAGGCIGAIALGDQSATSHGFWDAFVVLLDAAGEPRWLKTFGGTGADNLMSLAFDANGDLIATGVIQDIVQFGTMEMGASGQTTAVAAKLDGATGGVVWARGLGPIASYHSAVAALDPQGNIVVATSLAGAFNFGGGCPVITEVDDVDVAVVKLDPRGDCLWARHFLAPGDQKPERVVVDGAGDIVLGGAYRGAVDFGFGKHQLRGKQDAFLLKLAPDGQPVWSRSFGDMTDDADAPEQVNGLDVDAAGNTYLAGSFDGAVGFCDDGIPMQSAGSADIYIAKYAP